MNTAMLNLLLLWSGKIPTDGEEGLKKKLEKLSIENISALEKIPLKNPNIALILCILLGAFGVEDFYRNRHKLGTFKLICTTIVWCILFVWYVLVEEFDYPLYAQGAMIGMVIFALWAILAIVWIAINLLNVNESIKNDNLKTIEKYINMSY